MTVISADDVLAARERIAGRIHRTPLVRSRALSEMTGYEVFFKAENLQKTGSFKIRGACNKILPLSEEEGRRGIITASSGNHGQAVAYAARLCGYSATVIMPEGGSPVKAASIKDYGAELLFCGTKSGERIALAQKMCAESGAVFVPPYDDPFVMAGQGTVGLEILEDLEDASAVLVPTGGCGLISGIAAAIKEKKPDTAVFGVEPEGSASTGISFRAGKRTALDHINTVADGIRTTIPGELTFPVVQKYVDDMLTVTDEDVIRAQLLILERCKLLAEPTGAVAFAALLRGALPEKFRGKRVVSLISGGNVTLRQLADCIRAR
ncbi:MAG: pyridoxal-phosphate dependent enzyme [Synergistaceae bacterium]|jgi:threonine dehydratase|nr:pyridoxal-phosphate dependent enzyme [Synergistaceae bacterium]